MNLRTAVNWKVFGILLAGAAFGLVAIVPYSLALQANSLASVKLPMPLPALVAVQIATQLVPFALMILVGLVLATRVGLGLPTLEAKLRGEPVADVVRRWLPLSAGIGVASAAMLILLDVLVFAPFMPAGLSQASTVTPSAWKGLLASFYGGIDEEILLRLFAMTLLVWLGRFVSHTPDGLSTRGVLWSANVLAAVLFGLGHLPATALLVPLTAAVVVRAIVLNGLVGVACGYLYVKDGFESAMVAHFSADIVLHVVLAL